MLFVDDGDSDRGPMAEALAGAYGMDAESVGTAPAPALTEAASAAMVRSGLQLGHRPHWIDLHHLMSDYDRIIALADGLQDSCPDLHVQEAWHIPHPQPYSLAENEAVRDAIERRIQGLAAEMRAWT